MSSDGLKQFGLFGSSSSRIAHSIKKSSVTNSEKEIKARNISEDLGYAAFFAKSGIGERTNKVLREFREKQDILNKSKMNGRKRDAIKAREAKSTLDDLMHASKDDLLLAPDSVFFQCQPIEEETVTESCSISPPAA